MDTCTSCQHHVSRKHYFMFKEQDFNINKTNVQGWLAYEASYKRKHMHEYIYTHCHNMLWIKKELIMKQILYVTKVNVVVLPVMKLKH